VLAFDQATIATLENVALIDVAAVLVLQPGVFHQDNVGLFIGAVDGVKGHAGHAFPGDEAWVIVHLTVNRFPGPELNVSHSYAADKGVYIPSTTPPLFILAVSHLIGNASSYNQRQLVAPDEFLLCAGPSKCCAHRPQNPTAPGTAGPSGIGAAERVVGGDAE